MIKAVLFDLDGVLVDADKWHFNALNVALQHADIEPLSWQEHLTIYKGIPTKKKLQILTERKGLPQDLWTKINRSKQEVTEDIIAKFCTPDPEKIEMMRLLKKQMKIVVCSNAIRSTVERMLTKSDLMPFVDFYLSNEDVKNSKPAPDIYLAAFERLGLQPEECAIVEDSDVGKQAALAARGVPCFVQGPNEVNYYRVLRTIIEAGDINVVIPAAGQGKRFFEVGCPHPKPLIDVRGRPMIQLVMDNFKGLGRPIVLMQKKHVMQYCADAILRTINPSCHVVEIDGLTEGAACTVLCAQDKIDNRNELIIANSDQLVDVDLRKFVGEMRRTRADAGILTFHSDHPKWSYAKTDGTSRVVEVAEKVVISPHATVGIYYFRRGADFVEGAKSMIQKNIRINNEFYVAPVLNELIAEGKNVQLYEILATQMHGLGTPEDLDAYLKLNAETEIIELGEEDLSSALSGKLQTADLSYSHMYDDRNNASRTGTTKL